MALFARINAKKRQGETYIAIDLGTEKIKTLVFTESGGQCLLSGKGKIGHRNGTMRGGMVVNLPEVTEDARAAVTMAYEQAGISPRNLVVSLSGDLVRGLVTTVHYHRARPESHIDINELKNIIYKTEWKAFEQMRGLLAKEQADAQLGIKLINTTVVDTRIDGYKVGSPVGFQGGVITLSIFNAFAPLVHLGTAQALADGLKLDLVSVVAGPYALAKSCLVNDPEFSAIFIDVGGYLTDIAVVNEGGIFGLQNFALGGSAFTKSLAAGLKVAPERAEQIKIDYSHGLLDKRSEIKIKTILKSTAALWVRGVAESLDEFSHLDILPNKIFLAGGGALLPEIRNVLLTKAWAEQLPFTKKPYPAVISPADISGLVTQNQIELDGGDLLVLGLARLTLTPTDKKDTLSDVLRRIVLNMPSG